MNRRSGAAFCLVWTVATAAIATPAWAADVGTGPYALVSVSSGQLMDVEGGSTAAGAPVIQWPGNGGANQQWTFTKAGSGYTIKSVNSGLCLENPGAGAQLDQAACIGAANEQWSVQTAADGTATLTATGLLADVEHASSDPGTAVIGWPANGGANQRWRLTPLTRVGSWTAGLNAQGRTFTNQTVRMVSHANAAGSGVRVRLTNLYGDRPLSVGAVDVAVQDGGGRAVAGTHHAVRFSGAATATVPAGADLTSDPVTMSVGADQDLLVSVYLPGTTGVSTWHADARDTTYLSTAGNHAAEDSTANYPNTATSWFFLAGLDVISSTAKGTLVAVGDSITDGAVSTLGANARWPDDLARRFAAASGGPGRGVVDVGIGSNRVLTDAGSDNPSLLRRFAHDVLAQPGVTDGILLEGINDIGNNAGPNGGALTTQDLIDGYRNLIGQAHNRGVRLYGGTILPFKGAGYYSDGGEQIRQEVNQWIRTSGAFDGVIDFDAALRDPSDPQVLYPPYDCGDHLHPSDAGYQAMADAVDLSLFS